MQLNSRYDFLFVLISNVRPNSALYEIEASNCANLNFTFSSKISSLIKHLEYMTLGSIWFDVSIFTSNLTMQWNSLHVTFYRRCIFLRNIRLGQNLDQLAFDPSMSLKIKSDGAVGTPHVRFHNYCFIRNVSHNSAPLRDTSLYILSDLDLDPKIK